MFLISCSLFCNCSGIQKLFIRVSFSILAALSSALEQGSAVAAVAQDHGLLMNGTRRSHRPAKISEIHVLGQTNETLLIGWKKPPHADDSADLITTQYQMNLRNSHNELVSDQSIEVDPSPAKRRTNYMYIFVNLQPGSRYLFQVRACCASGCGNWSEPPLEAQTADGHADAPADVQAYCVLDQERQVNNVTVTWSAPDKPRGVIIGYNISVEGHSKFVNERNEETVDHVREWHVATGNTTHKYEGRLLFNTNYTIRICTLNRAGCGSLSHITATTMCATPATLPASVASPGDLMLTRADPGDPTCRQVRVVFPRVSERNGTIKCYKLVMIRLPRSSEAELLPRHPSDMNISINSYEEVHSDILPSSGDHATITSPVAYIPEEFPTDRLVTDVIVGDDKSSRCGEEEYRIARGIKPDLTGMRVKTGTTVSLPNWPARLPASVTDGVLAPTTNYTAFIEILVTALNGQLLKKRSNYFPVVETGDLILGMDERESDAVNSLSPFAPFLYSMTESPKAVFFGVSSGLLIFCLLVFVLCFLKKKVAGSSTDSDTNSEDNQTQSLHHTLKRSGSIVTGQKDNHVSANSNITTATAISTACHHKWIGQPIFTHSLAHVFIERHADNDLLFQAEFEALPEVFADRTCIAADLPENVAKNRYPDVKSYDQTRVRLPLIDGIGSDYINADFVEGYRGRKLFICAQGPLPNTVPDFWRMIYEHKVSVVVMLTGIEEQGKIKCAQYWSDEEGEDFLVSDLYAVRLQSKRCFADFVIRSLVLRSQQQDYPQEERHILQFHFLLWKDFLAPEQPSWLLRFIRRVNEYYCPDKGPLLVHCSAGVGRTGTFVAIDSLLPDVGESDFVNVWECVAHMRSQRNFLVQSLKQYMFVYRAIVEYSQFGETDVELRHLTDHYKQLREQRFAPEFDGVLAEFDRLNAVIEDPKTTCVGLLAVNMTRNRFEFITPYDMNRVLLSSQSPEECTYINASFVQGYDRFLSFIVTQDPLQSTLSEFWRMISEQSISRIVMLSDAGPGLMNCPVYWPQSDQTYDYIVVHLDSEESEDCCIKRTFTVRNEKSGQSISSTQFQFLGWQNTMIPESTHSFTQFVVNTLQSNSGQETPICVHCSSGTERCAVFVTLASLSWQMLLEQRVDVFQTARYTRSQRTLMLQEPVQYDFLYRSLIDYVTSRNLCDMADTQL